ncbi:MAG: NAD(P)-dependent alcohol dehydrogenase, partial [Acidimicrobiia bacterium]|nr:NAD(P)-dependent alcohol dehydrogenase [Acidimicrobiia bacterium]
DEVVGELMYHGSKGFAEYVAVSERATLVTKPAGVTFAQAASIPQTGLIALQGIRAKGGLQPGESLLIVGGGGGSGTLAIQMAKRIGARVTGVDNTSKLPTMRDVGADEVVDYTVDDYTKLGVRYDRILDLVGARSLFANRRVLAERGVYLVVGGPVRRILGAAVLGKLVSVGRIGSMGVLMVRPNVVDLASLLEAVEARRIDPVIERTYRLDATPEALQKLGDNLARGKLVVGFE